MTITIFPKKKTATFLADVVKRRVLHRRWDDLDLEVVSIIEPGSGHEQRHINHIKYWDYMDYI